MQQFRTKITCKEVSQGKHPWWALHRPRDPLIFAAPKIIGLTTSKRIELVYDKDGSLFVTDAMYVFRVRQGVDPLVCIAVMQSSAFLFFYRVANQGESRVIPQVKAAKLYDLPFPETEGKQVECETLLSEVRSIMALYKRLDDETTGHSMKVIERQIESTDDRIDELVCKLYGLTDEEIRVVEEATNPSA